MDNRRWAAIAGLNILTKVATLPLAIMSRKGAAQSVVSPDCLE
jgi:hypothetical protein